MTESRGVGRPAGKRPRESNPARDTAPKEPPASKAKHISDDGVAVKDRLRARVLELLEDYLARNEISERKFCQDHDLPGGLLSSWRQGANSVAQWSRADGNPGVKHERWPNVHHIVQLAEVLDVSIDHLFREPGSGVDDLAISGRDDATVARLRQEVSRLREQLTALREQSARSSPSDVEKRILATVRVSGLDEAELNHAVILYMRHKRGEDVTEGAKIVPQSPRSAVDGPAWIRDDPARVG